MPVGRNRGTAPTCLATATCLSALLGVWRVASVIALAKLLPPTPSLPPSFLSNS